MKNLCKISPLEVMKNLLQEDALNEEGMLVITGGTEPVKQIGDDGNNPHCNGNCGCNNCDC